ncbi:MAG: TolC family protein [Bacteroidales bacterium]
MKKIISIIVLLSAFATAYTQEYLTLEKVRKLALSNNNDIKIAEAMAQKSLAEQKAARSNYLPSASVEAIGIYRHNNYEIEQYLPSYTPDLSTGELTPNVITDPSTGNVVVGSDGMPLFNMYAYMPLEISMRGAYMANINLEQAVYTGGKIAAGNKMTDIGIEMSEENIQLKELNAISEADNAYWLYVSVQTKIKLAESSVEMLDRLLTRVRNSYDAGLTSRGEVLKAQVEYDKARLNLQKARSGLELTRMSLCRVTGLDFSTPIVTDSIIAIPEYSIQQGVNEDVVNRPEYKLMTKGIEIEEQRIRTVRSDYLPEVGISAGYGYLGGIDINSSEYRQGSLNIMASVKIPIFNWGEGRQKIESARAIKATKEYELAKNTDLLRLETERAKLNLQDALLRIDISQSGLEQASENLRISNDNYDAGRETLTDRLIAQTQWEKAYSELIDAKTSYKIEETEYFRVTASFLKER